MSSIEIDDELVNRFINAAINGDVKTVEEMLIAGMPADHADVFARTALIKAAQFNRTDVIRLLLQNGADVHKPNRFGNTPVHLAAIRNSIDAIAVLLEHGASINITNYRGEKPVDIALRYNMKTVVRMLEQL